MMRGRRSDIMEFLILLNDDDYQACTENRTFHKKILKMGKKFPGILHVDSLLDINEVQVGEREPKYIIKRMAMPHQTYIKLPKEGLYVKSEEFEMEYMKSQIQEVILICGLLGAKNIRYDITQNDEESKKVGASLDMGELVSGVGVEVGARMNTGSQVESQLMGEVEFGETEDLDVSFEALEKEEAHGNIHYLVRLPQWMGMVDNRLRRRVSRSEFKYSYNRELYINANVINKVRGMGIDFEYGSNKLSNMSIMFHIEYYPMSEKNILDRVVSENSLLEIEVDVVSNDGEKITGKADEIIEN